MCSRRKTMTLTPLAGEPDWTVFTGLHSSAISRGALSAAPARLHDENGQRYFPLRESLRR